MRPPLAAALVLSGLAMAAAVPPARAQGGLSIEPRFVVLGARQDSRGVAVTPPQRVFIEPSGNPASEWTATADQPWVDVQPTHGRFPGRLTIGIRHASPLPAADAETTVTFATTNGSRTDVRVAFKRLERAEPIGSVDAPAEYAEVEGRGRLFGWALHPLALSRILICREQGAAKPRVGQPDDPCGQGLTHLGDATTYYLPRPDVAASFPSMPMHDRAGWTYVLDAAQLGREARGRLRLQVIAEGIDGSRAAIGSRTITVLPEPAAALPARLRHILWALAAAFAAHLLLGWLVMRRPPNGPGELAPPRPSSIEIAAVTALAVLALAMSVPAMWTSLTYDELYLASLYAVGVPVWTAALHATTFIHIAYAVSASAVVHLLGPAEFSLRLPAALFGAASVVAVWRYARPLIGPAAALISAAVLALLPFHAHWSRMAKGYTGLALATLLALHGFSAVTRHASRRGAVEHAAGLALGLYFHLYAVFVFLVQYALFAGLAAVGSRRINPASARVLWWSFLAGGVGAVLLYSPVAIGLMQPLSYFGEQTGSEGSLLRELLAEFGGTDRVVLQLAILALAGLGVVALWRRSWLEALQLVALLVVPVALVGGIVQPKALGARYFGYWTPALAVLLAAGTAALAGWIGDGPAARYRHARAIIAGALLAILAVGWSLTDVTVGPRNGYGERLAPLNAPPREPVFAIGADAEMFSYYVTEPLASFTSPDQLDHALRMSPPFRVAYHDVPWNSPEQRQMQALLQKRCPANDQGIVKIYECGR